MTGSTRTEDWKAEWQPVIDAVGRDFSSGQTVFGADPVDVQFELKSPVPQTITATPTPSEKPSDKPSDKPSATASATSSGTPKATSQR